MPKCCKTAQNSLFQKKMKDSIRKHSIIARIYKKSLYCEHKFKKWFILYKLGLPVKAFPNNQSNCKILMKTILPKNSLKHAGQKSFSSQRILCLCSPAATSLFVQFKTPNEIFIGKKERFRSKDRKWSRDISCVVVKLLIMLFLREMKLSSIGRM